MAQVMCKCRRCGIRLGIKTGLSAGGHITGIVLCALTGLLFIPLYLVMICCGGNTRCTHCGSVASKL